MFDLNHAIAKWRREMTAVEMKGRRVLDELQGHLEEEIERQVQSGMSAEKAFQIAVRRLGQACILADEFSKVGAANRAVARIKYFFLSLTGIQNLTLATNMNTSSSNGNREPAWATYLKSGAFALPAAALWMFVAVFVFPKFNAILAEPSLQLPGAVRFGVGLMQLLAHYSVILTGGVVLAVALLEWRSEKWPKYRRAAFGVGAFFLNSAVLIAITTMVILALVAPDLLKHVK